MDFFIFCTGTPAPSALELALSLYCHLAQPQKVFWSQPFEISKKFLVKKS